jgi:uncharacterized OB-fold protein
MPELELRCPDCGRAVPLAALCAACEQDRVMEQAQLSASASLGKGLRCND